MHVEKTRARRQPPAGMTELELECLRLTALGSEAAKIGAELKLSVREVELLLFCAQRKLGASNTLHAVTLFLLKEMAEA